MKVEIKVPAMGESISEATVGTIIKPSGTVVATDDEVLELETDKVNQVLYAPQSGTLSLNVKPEDVVKIGQVIGYVDTDGTAAEKPAPAAEKKQPQEKQEPIKELAPKAAKPEPSKTSQVGVRATKETFIADIKTPEKKSEPKQPAPAPRAITPSKPGEKRETRRKMTRIRKVIAQRLVEAQHSAAMLTTFNEVDLSHVMALREKFKEDFQKKFGSKLGFMSFFVKAATSALEAFPDVNSYIDGDEIVHREYYDIGIAVGTDRGLVVPVLRECERLTFGQIEQEIEGFAKKARDGSITMDELQGGGFTITNGGVYGSLLSTPILNPPQSAILGMHKIEKRPVVVDDQIVIRPMMYLALSYDHRLIDGKEAVSFLVHIKNVLEDPSRLLLEI